MNHVTSNLEINSSRGYPRFHGPSTPAGERPRGFDKALVVK